MQEFIIEAWPALDRRKIVWKVVSDPAKEIFSAVPTGGSAPLSKCCKMSLCFQFTRQLGGKVVCLDSLCA